MSEDATTHRCATCGFRSKAEQKPRSFLGILWKLHTYICPGWKAYQRSLARQAASSPEKRDAS
jgi:hypothetical protein